MASSSRYAIYYAPESGSELADFGAKWLGWDAEAGQYVPHPDYGDLPLSLSEITVRPRKYGFHSTLKAPFRLAHGKTVADLNEAVGEFAYQQPPFEIDRVSLQSIGGFLAIAPVSDCSEMAELAGNCVRDLDEFRAPLFEADFARRRTAKLSAIQEDYLQKWGYPYVFDEFRFHMTLTGKLPPEVRKQVLARLESELSVPLSRPLAVREICLLRENSDGNFYILKRHSLQAGRPGMHSGFFREARHFG